MDFAGVTYLGIRVATAVWLVIGGTGHDLLSKPWLKVARIDPNDAWMTHGPFIWPGVCRHGTCRQSPLPGIWPGPHPD